MVRRYLDAVYPAAQPRLRQLSDAEAVRLVFPDQFGPGPGAGPAAGAGARKSQLQGHKRGAGAAHSDDAHEHEHEDEHHLNLLIYYCLAIVPVLASLILLPNTCYSIPGRRRVNREEKMD